MLFHLALARGRAADMNAARAKRDELRLGLAHARWLVALEMGIFASVFIADQHHLIRLSKTPYWLALAWLSLRVRGLRWRDVGFSLPSDWRRLALLGVGVGTAMEALELLVTQPLLVRMTGQYPDLSVFAGAVGNAPELLLTLAGSWILAALGEELVWRGYLLNRLTDLLGRTRRGWALGFVVMGAAFGLAHAPQGFTGVAENVIDGLLLGALYLFCGRNLLAPIVAHGMTDSIDSLLIYSGHYPGM
jgi:hypothetical protein